jgi:hypothetical protein
MSQKTGQPEKEPAMTAQEIKEQIIKTAQKSAVNPVHPV